MNIQMNRRRAVQVSSPATNYLMTAKSNPEVFAICLAQGWCSSEGMTYEEAAAVTSTIVRIDNNNVRVFNRSNIVHFEEFLYFGVTNVDSSAFFNCVSLQNIKLPSNTTSLAGTVFQGCSSLESIDIPATVSSIGSNCFVSCPSMQYAIVRAITPPTLGNGTAFGARGTTYPIYVPDESVNAYKAANYWNGEFIIDRIKPISEFVKP